ncbi:hypothetical protein MCOR01_002213 [Pyricularia oryzae]|nr:hypothetical protein MCOR01_002213 [Pyricularia oryzae]
MSTPNSTDGTAEPKYEPIRIENGDQIGMLVVSIFCMVVPTVTVIMRFMARARVARDSRFSMSDWLLIPCLVALYGLSIANFLMVFEGGFTYDQSTIPTRFGPDTLVAFLKCMAAWPIIWNCAIFTSKLSVLLMYSMLMPVRNMVLAVRCCAVFLALYNLSGIIAGFTICQPFSKNWDVSGQEPGHCGDVRLFYQWLSGINVFCDLLLFLLPMPVLYTLKLAPRKKIVLAALLCVGVFDCHHHNLPPNPPDQHGQHQRDRNHPLRLPLLQPRDRLRRDPGLRAPPPPPVPRHLWRRQQQQQQPTRHRQQHPRAAHHRRRRRWHERRPQVQAGQPGFRRAGRRRRRFCGQQGRAADVREQEERQRLHGR